MTIDFTSVRNRNEHAVYEALMRHAPRYRGLAGHPELLAETACVALNRLPPRYMRHAADFGFYLGERERINGVQQSPQAVENALGYVQARTAARARG